jgi:hypothetical protein|eukprot:COSAG06_NODE_2710_length_6406_cov_2.807198_2_plen_59_part_00
MVASQHLAVVVLLLELLELLGRAARTAPEGQRPAARQVGHVRGRVAGRGRARRVRRGL